MKINIYLKSFASLILICLIGFNAICQIDTAGPVSKDLIRNVVEITKGGFVGSGFIVQMGKKFLLVTNKHMIGEWSPVDSLIYSDKIGINLYGGHGATRFTYPIGIPLTTNCVPNNKRIKVHPNPKIDIAVVDITYELNAFASAASVVIDTSMLLNMEGMKKLLTYGSQVFTIGYPNGQKAFTTNEPLVKAGFISSSIDGDLIIEQTWVNRKNQKIKILSEGKIFIVDGLIIPGNSGGPVLLSREVKWFYIGGELVHYNDMNNAYIGIVSNITPNTGLTVIFSSDNIMEVIRLFI